MKKNFVLDTNVLLHEPQAMFKFADNNVVIPIYVIEEIDQFKRDMTELGRNARTVSRNLDEIRARGKISEGVKLEGGGSIKVMITAKTLPKEFAMMSGKDNSILAVALDLKEKEPEAPLVFVSKDANLRIRADALGIKAVNFDTEKVDIEELYAGNAEVDVSEEEVDEFYAKGELRTPKGLEVFPNQYFLLRDKANPSHSALGKAQIVEEKIVPIANLKHGVWGLKPRNKEQHFALDVCLDDKAMLVTLVGKAGTGKTLLAIAAGLQKVAEEKKYVKLLVSRPVYPLGKDIGFLPGDIEEKLTPWMQPIYDNIDLLMGLSREEKRNGRGAQELFDLGLIEIEPLTYIRGRSIPSQYMIVDEAQNLTPHEVKTIITRVGDNTKIVFTGDPYQIDNPYVDSSSNGLTYVVNKFKGQKIAGHITLTRGERSELAELASNIL